MRDFWIATFREWRAQHIRDYAQHTGIAPRDMNRRQALRLSAIIRRMERHA